MLYSLTPEQKIANWEEQIRLIDRKVANLEKLKSDLEKKISRTSSRKTGLAAFDRAINSINP
jgi:prefoldin subunit 5